MREVQRLADRIVLVWIQLDGITLTEWRKLPIESKRRQALVLDERLIHVNPGDIDPDDQQTILAFQPAGTGWYYRGSRGWVGPGTTRVKSFSTPSFDLEPGDVCIDGQIVYWKPDALGDTDEAVFREARLDEVTITRRAGDNVITEVRKKRV